MKFSNELKRFFLSTVLAETKGNYALNCISKCDKRPLIQGLYPWEKIHDELFDRFVETFLTDDRIGQFLANNSHLLNSTVFTAVGGECWKLRNKENNAKENFEQLNKEITASAIRVLEREKIDIMFAKKHFEDKQTKRLEEIERQIKQLIASFYLNDNI